MANVAIELAPPPAIVRVAAEAGVPQPAIFGGRNLKLVFQDEFNGQGQPSPQWSRTFFWGGRALPTNKEEQVYTDPAFLKQRQIELPDSASIADGVLTLRADRVAEADAQKLGGKYASGIVTTYNSYAFRYGVVEIRAKAPKGKGLWSALWMLRKDKGSKGEIDIMEVLGDRPDFLNTTFHMSEDGVAGINRFVRQKTVDLTADFHTYTLLWSENEIAIALDGKELARTKTPDALKADMYVLINLAVGGKWPGSPNPSTMFPAEFKIDYVRIWQETLDKRP